MPQESITTWFQSLGCTTKDDIAASLARIFPELTLDLPPKRNTWQSEHPRMTVFEAIALGLIYWHQSGMVPAYSGPCGHLIPFEVGTSFCLMWAAIPL